MLYYNRIDISEGIDSTKSNKSRQCMIYHYLFFNQGFKFQYSVCNACHDLTMLGLNISDIAITTVKNVDNHYIMYNISKSEAINLFENSPEDLGFECCLNFQSIQDSFFYIFNLAYIKWLILWTSVSL